MEALFTAAFKSYGVVGLIFCAVLAMAATAIAQFLATRKWMSQTGEIITQMGVITSAMSRQGQYCDRHYEALRDHMQVLRSIGDELRGLVDAIHSSDMERARELMQIIEHLARKK
jgi:hypothetical protein